jgi:glycosyltransferase involved in cell wall biosynthesis
MNNPGNIAKISIVIVTYNAAETLQKCLKSIFNQQYTNIETIIIDGKSTDDTIKIIRDNGNKIAFWISEKDFGVYDAMNKALKYISGEWVYFIGADDELLPDFSRFAIELESKKHIYYANVFSNGVKRLGKLSDYQLAKFGLYHQSMIFPRSVFERYKYNTKYKISADFALTLTLYGDKEFDFIYKDYIIANFNHSGLSGIQIDTHFQKDRAALVFENFGLITWIRYRIHKFKNRKNPRA